MPLRRRRTLVVSFASLGVACAGLTLVVGPASAAGPTVGVADSVTSIRPTATPAGLPGSASLVAARNEYESVQLVVSGPATNVSVSGNLFGWGTTELYREGTYNVTTPSDLEARGPSGAGDPYGAWPDPLIPETDMVYGEDRNAFPFNVPAGENVVVWVDVFVPPGTAAGEYDGALAVSANGGTTNVPVHLEVLNFTIPSTSTLPTIFMAQADQGNNHACLGHTGSATCNGDTTLRKTLNSLYQRMGLEDRLTQSNGFGFAHNQSPAFWPAADWEAWFEGPAIRGGTPYPPTAGFHLNGPQPTTVSQYAYVDYQCLAACAQGWAAEANEAGQAWADKFLWYGCDEANNPTQWNSCKTNLDQAQGAFDRPAVASGRDWAQWSTNGAPTGIDIDVLAPYFQHFQPITQGGVVQPSNRSQYDTWVGQGHRLWMATACDAAGCTGANWDDPHAQYTGSPGYQLDGPANQSRSMPWFLDRFDISGELHWSSQQTLPNAWDQQFYSGMNGDGNLFYAGTPARIGGTTHIPVESIRLKRFRDGREDHEYLSWLRANGYGAQVDAIVAGLYPTMYSATWAKDGHGAGSLLSARTQLVDLVRAATGAGGPGSYGRILYTSDADGDHEIWNVAHDGSDPRKMTENTVADTFPAWSPASDRIAFVRGGDLWLMNADGTGAQLVTANASKPAWSPDGQWLYFVRGGGVLRIRTDGSGVPEDTADGYDPDVAPDGRVFHSKVYDELGGVHVYAKTIGGADTEITYGPIDEAVDVSPDGSKITFSRADLNYTSYSVYVGGTDGAPDDFEVIPGGAYQSAFAPDSEALVYSSGGTQIWRADVDGDAKVQLTSGAGLKVNPAWGAPGVLPPVVPPPVKPVDPTTPTTPTTPAQTCGGKVVTVSVALGQKPGAGNDVVLGTSGPDTIKGKGGKDTICGLGGKDRLVGGPGKDVLKGGAGKDRCLGGPGRDKLSSC